MFFSNRSAAHLSKGDAANALLDADECIKVAPAWGKGYGRKGAALFALGRYAESVAVYEEGMKVEPSDALKEGLEEATKMASRPAPGAGSIEGAFPGLGGDLIAKLAANPKFAPHLSDPTFVAGIKRLQTDKAYLQGILSTVVSQITGQPAPKGVEMPKDMRIMEALMDIIGFGAGGEDEEEEAPKSAPAPAPAKAAAPAPAPEETLTEEEKEKRQKKKEADVHKDEGNAHYKRKEFDAALACYQKATEAYPDEITYRLNSAAVLMETGKLDECIQMCRDAIAKGREVFSPYPVIAKCFARIGNALYKQGNLPAAIASYEDSLMESHADDVYEKLKKWKTELKKKQESEYRDPVKAAEAKERGNEAFKAGDFPRSVQEYTEAIKRDPDNAVYYNNRAAAKSKLMDFPAALEDCEKSLKLDPKYTKAWIRKGTIQSFMKEFHKALETYQRALELEPDNAEAKKGLAETVAKINMAQSSTTDDSERTARAMQDPEIVGLLRDPAVSVMLDDLSSGRKNFNDLGADSRAKISKLIAAGVLKVA